MIRLDYPSPHGTSQRGPPLAPDKSRLIFSSRDRGGHGSGDLFVAHRNRNAAKRSVLETLTPVCAVDGRDYLLLTPQLAGISAQELGPAIADLSSERQIIIAALDLLFTGI